MRTSRRSFMAGLVAGLVLVGMLTTNFVVAQPSGQGSSAGLGSLVQTATSAFAYAQGVVNAASSHGLGVSSEVGLLAKGNLSLTAADAALDPGGNVSAGLEDAHDAMGNFTAAAADASEALDAASLTPSFDVQ